MTTDVDMQGDRWNPHTGLRVPEIAEIWEADLLLRSGEVILQEDASSYGPYWHWSDGSENPNDIVAFRLP